MKKLFIVVMMFALMITSVYAYDVNMTKRIIGEYKINDVFTDANANISIKDIADVWKVFNVEMINITTGRFYYDYNCTKSGQYTASIIFINSSNEGSTMSDVFYCGDPNRMSVGACPTSALGIILMWVFMILLIVLAVVGIAYSYAILTGVAGALLILMAVITWSCGDIITYFSVIIGLIFLLIAANLKN